MFFESAVFLSVVIRGALADALVFCAYCFGAAGVGPAARPALPPSGPKKGVLLPCINLTLSILLQIYDYFKENEEKFQIKFSTL